MALPPDDADSLLRRAVQGDPAARECLLADHRPAMLHAAAALLGDWRSAPFGPDDVVQDACVVAWKRLPAYLEARPMPFDLWVRQLVWQSFVDLVRFHTAQKRDAGRDRPLDPASDSAGPGLPRAAWATTTPSRVAMAREHAEMLARAVQALPPKQCQMITLVHACQLSLKDAARQLDLPERTARWNYVQALKHLRAALPHLEPESAP